MKNKLLSVLVCITMLFPLLPSLPAFAAQTTVFEDDFEAVLKTIKLFLVEPFIAAIDNKSFDNKWSCVTNQWKKGV